MKKFFASTLLAVTALTSLSANAQAIEFQNPIEQGLTEVQLFETPVVAPSNINHAMLRSDANIAVARLDGGRMIPMPFGETVDWSYLDQRVEANISELEANTYIKYIPEIPFFGQDTDNKIDEIRLAAANEGKDYVVIYGVGPDASWASFGKKALSETGLKVREDCNAWQAAKAKALLVDSFTGDVLGAVTSDNIEFNIGELADRVGEMITELSGPTVSKV